MVRLRDYIPFEVSLFDSFKELPYDSIPLDRAVEENKDMNLLPENSRYDSMPSSGEQIHDLGDFNYELNGSSISTTAKSTQTSLLSVICTQRGLYTS